MTDRTDRAFAAITARARRAAGEVPADPPPQDGRDPLGDLSRLLVSPEGAPPCAQDGCTDPAYVGVLTTSGTAEDATPYCGRHARRVWLDTTSVIVPLSAPST